MSGKRPLVHYIVPKCVKFCTMVHNSLNIILWQRQSSAVVNVYTLVHPVAVVINASVRHGILAFLKPQSDMVQLDQWNLIMVQMFTWLLT